MNTCQGMGHLNPRRGVLGWVEFEPACEYRSVSFSLEGVETKFCNMPNNLAWLTADVVRSSILSIYSVA